MRKERNKLKPGDIDKIRARFVTKYEEFDKLPLHDELEEDGVTVKVRGLRTIFREDKMSSTDKRALVTIVDRRLQQQMEEIRKQADNINKEMGTENEPDPTEGQSIPTEE